MAAIIPVILAGGAGTRLWPVAREDAPKQFHAFDAETSMLKQTVARFADDARFAEPLIACGADHRALVERDLDGVARGALLLEPCRRNTAPAIAAAAEYVRREFGAERVMAIVPVDHAMSGSTAFRNVLSDAARVAASGQLVVVGIKPVSPETGYGYIACGARLPHGGFAVGRFVEKPDGDTARGFLSAGNFLWNAGMIVARADALLAECAQVCPEVADAARKAVEEAGMARGVVELNKDAYAAAPAISFDYAVLERSRSLAVVRGDFDWADLGTWSAIRKMQTPDGDGNVLTGDVHAEDCRNVFVRSDSGTIAVLGLEDMIVVRDGDAVLIAPISRAQDIGRLAETLAAAKKRR